MDALAIIATTYIEGRTEPSGHIHARAIVTALHAAGLTILHRDENHGPTLERAGTKLAGIEPDEDAAGVPANWDDFVQIAQASIRAMEVKRDG